MWQDPRALSKTSPQTQKNLRGRRQNASKQVLKSKTRVKERKHKHGPDHAGPCRPSFRRLDSAKQCGATEGF